MNTITIKVQDTTERELKIELPVSFKTDVAYYYIVSETRGLAIWPAIDTINPIWPVVALREYSPERVCLKSEVMEAFDIVVKRLRLKFLVMDTDHNNPTELLEELTK